MEKRIIDEKVEIREEGDKKYITGLGIVFNRESKDLGGFTEIIEPTALDKANMEDVIVRAEHSNDYVLGRTSSGTASLSKDGKGVRYDVEIPNTTVGRDTAEYIKRGDLKGSSFAFSGVSDRWAEDKNGKVTRTITGIAKIHDIGPVFNPAYGQTDNQVALRSLEEWREKEKEEKTVEKPTEKKKPAEEVKPLPGLSLKDKVRLKRLRG